MRWFLGPWWTPFRAWKALAVAIVATLDNVATQLGHCRRARWPAPRTVLLRPCSSALISRLRADGRDDDGQQGSGTSWRCAGVRLAAAGSTRLHPRCGPEAESWSPACCLRLSPSPKSRLRAIDNIAPLAVPSLSVLDAPNDQGSRIVLTWTLSPSDLVLQDVVAGAIGPLGAEPVVGVYGYNIYRRAASEDEFALVGQVDAGVASFIDETALNGVRYTYQVRPYDLDNETGSDLEQTAMAVRNLVVDSEGRTIFGLFGSDTQIGFDDFFIFADNFGLTAGRRRV